MENNKRKKQTAENFIKDLYYGRGDLILKERARFKKSLFAQPKNGISAI